MQHKNAITKRSDVMRHRALRDKGRARLDRTSQRVHDILTGALAGFVISIPIALLGTCATSCDAAPAPPPPEPVTGTTTGSAFDSSGFVEEPTTGPGVETEGGEVDGRWYSPCLTAEADFTSCEGWCQRTDFGECFTIQTADGACLPAGDGTNVLGYCNRNPFTEWLSGDTLRLRCVCKLP